MNPSSLRRVLAMIAGWIGRATLVWLASLRQPLLRRVAELELALGMVRAELELTRARLLRVDSRKRPHYGAVASKQSVAVIERFWRSLKREFADAMMALKPIQTVNRELALYATWFNKARPHTGLALRTPEEVFEGRRPRRRRRFGPRERLLLDVRLVGQRRSWPEYFLRRAA